MRVDATPTTRLGLWRADATRTVVIVAVFLRSIVRAVAHRVLPSDHATWGQAFARALADAFEDLGPTFVKIGQMITSSPSLFPPPLVEACQTHLYSARPVPAAEIRRVIAEDLGAPVHELFASFDDRHLAAASVAQVHACSLHDGREVVVKVQRPGIVVGMVTDLRILARLARLVDQIPQARAANLPGIVSDLRDVTIRELDFTHEAEVQQRFRDNLSSFGDNASVTVPEVVADLCGRRTITMERLYGIPLDEYVKRSPDLKEGETLLRRMFKAWLEAMMIHGPFHADVHAGNIWVLDDGRVAFLDFGISGELEPEWRSLVANLFVGSALGGGFESLARSTRVVGAIPEQAGTDAEVGGTLEMMFNALGDDEVVIGEVLNAVVEAFGQYGVKVPNELVIVAKQLLYLEGYVVALCPEFDLMADLYLLRNIFPDLVAARLAAGESVLDFPD